ncbi:MAG: alpha/beta fold hydrolase [Paracoccaceae bacterium]
MTHGFKYAPARDLTCPHTRIFSTGAAQKLAKSAQWLQPLGFGAGECDEGLAVAFGWNACGTVWTARKSAVAAGRRMADIIAQILRAAPDRPVHLIAHSMGSEVILIALRHLPANSVNRIVFLTGASYQSDAAEALKTGAGQTAEIINVISRENDVFDFLFEHAIAPPTPGDRTIGSGIHALNAINIQLDCILTLNQLNAFGVSISPPTRRVCHWSSYTRPGVLQFYAGLLRHPEKFPLKTLKRALPDQHSPRWSSLFNLPILPVSAGQTKESKP